MSDNTEFRAVHHFGEPLLINLLEQNLKSWIDWAMLRIGGWEDVSIEKNGFDYTQGQLLLTNDYGFGNNSVFQGARKDWVFENNVNYTSPTGGTFNPLPVQVYVDTIPVTPTTTGHEYYIDYSRGRIIFQADHKNNAIYADHSYRAVQTYLYDEMNWWFEVQYDSANTQTDQWLENFNNPVGTTSNTGDYGISSANRLQMPAIVIEGVANGNSRPFELGTLVGKNRQDILFHIISQDRSLRNNIADIFRLQKGKTIVLYDTYKIFTNNLFPLDSRGMLVNSPVMYPDIIKNNNVVFREATFIDINISNIKTDNPNLHWAIVRATLEVIY